MASETTFGSFEGVRQKWSGENLYSVMVSGERLVCVRLGGAMSVNGGRSIWAHFGLLGALIAYFVNKSAEKKRAAAQPALESTSLEELLARDAKNNFDVRHETITKAELGKPGFFKGSFAAKLSLAGAGADPHVFFISTKPHAQKALELLSPRLSDRLSVDPKLKWLVPTA